MAFREVAMWEILSVPAAVTAEGGGSETGVSSALGAAVSTDCNVPLSPVEMSHL